MPAAPREPSSSRFRTFVVRLPQKLIGTKKRSTFVNRFLYFNVGAEGLLIPAIPCPQPLVNLLTVGFKPLWFDSLRNYEEQKKRSTFINRFLYFNVGAEGLLIPAIPCPQPLVNLLTVGFKPLWFDSLRNYEEQKKRSTFINRFLYFNVGAEGLLIPAIPCPQPLVNLLTVGFKPLWFDSLRNYEEQKKRSTFVNRFLYFNVGAEGFEPPTPSV